MTHDHDNVHKDSHRELTQEEKILLEALTHEIRTVNFADPDDVDHRRMSILQPGGHVAQVETFRMAAHFAETASRWARANKGEEVSTRLIRVDDLVHESALDQMISVIREEIESGNLCDQHHYQERAGARLSECSTEDHTGQDPFAQEIMYSHPGVFAVYVAAHLQRMARLMDDHRRSAE